MGSTKGYKKCYSCGSMVRKPYIYNIIPSIPYGHKPPEYSKSSPKTKRVDLKGDKKVLMYFYCDRECYENYPPQKTYKI